MTACRDAISAALIVCAIASNASLGCNGKGQLDDLRSVRAQLLDGGLDGGFDVHVARLEEPVTYDADAQAACRVLALRMADRPTSDRVDSRLPRRDRTSAQSAAVRAIGPTWSSVHASDMTPSRGTRPYVGLSPVTPQSEAGIRIDPPVSVPSAKGNSRAATATAEPEDDPPAHRDGFHGLRVVLVGPAANSNVCSLATRTAPASSSRWATVALVSGTRSSYSRDPPVVLIPAVSMMSFNPNGTPSSGRALPSSQRRDASSARSRARSGRRVSVALRAPSTREIRSRHGFEHLDGGRLLRLVRNEDLARRELGELSQGASHRARSTRTRPRARRSAGRTGAARHEVAAASARSPHRTRPPLAVARP